MSRAAFRFFLKNLIGLGSPDKLFSWAQTSIVRMHNELSRWLCERPLLRGRGISPHFFRDAAATTLARMSSESARLISPVLAHSGFRTAERHYIHARTIDAGLDYASLIKRLKGDR